MLKEATASRDIDVGDGTLHVVAAGQGAEIVLLHGWTLDHRNWAPQLPLGNSGRLVMPDRRGFGQSTAPADLAREWQDIDHLVGSDRFVLVGLSQGASVALDYARRRPDRLAGLVLVGAPLHGAVALDNKDDALPRSLYAALVAEGQLVAMKAEWRAHPLTQTALGARPLLAAMLDGYDGRDLRAPPSAIMITAADIAALPVPVLAVAGVQDTPWRRRVADFIGASAPLGQVALINRAGHLCNLDNPAEFNAVLADFVSQILHEKA